MSVSVYDSVDLTMAVNNLESHQKTMRVRKLFRDGDVHTQEHLEFGYDIDHPHILYTRKQIEGSSPVEVKIGDLKRLTFPKYRPSGVLKEKDARKLDPSVAAYVGTSTDANTNLAAVVAKHLAKLRRRIDTTHMVNAISALTTGSVTFKYEDATTETLDLGFGSAGTAITSVIRTTLSGTTAPTAIWTHANAVPLDNLETAATAMRAVTGYDGPIDVLMGTAAWNAFKVHSTVKDLLDNRRIVGSEIRANENMEYKGEVNGFRIYHVTFQYLLNTTWTEAWNTNTIALVPSEDPEGWFSTEYGAPFEFPEGSNVAQFIPVQYFSKAVRIEDPPVQKVILESRPVPLIKNPQAVRVWTVIS